MGLLSSVSTELFPSRVHGISGDGFVVGGEGIGRSKIRQAMKTIKRKGPKALKKGAAVAYELAQAFGDANTRKKADSAMRAADIVRTAGSGHPGDRLRRLVR